MGKPAAHQLLNSHASLLAYETPFLNLLYTMNINGLVEKHT